MSKDKETTLKARADREKSRKLKAHRVKMKAGDEILATMLNTPPKTHDNMKKKD